jgi:hypothetical protein
VLPEMNLKKLERKAWRSVFQDGLWDIYLGLILLGMAIGALLSDVGIATEKKSMLVYVGVLVLAMLALWAGKRFITLPRMGHARFSPQRQARRKKVKLILAISALVGVLLFVFTWTALRLDWSQGLSLRFIGPAVWIMNSLVLFSLGAYFLDYERLVLIGVMYAVSVPFDLLLTKLTGLDLTFVAFGAPAAVILVIGLVILMRFLRNYPIPVKEEPPAAGIFHGNQ